MSRPLAINRAVGLRRAVGLDRTVGMLQPDVVDVEGLRGYQALGSRFMRAHDRAILADEMALGKTAQELRALPRNARTVVLCPASVVAEWASPTRGQIRRWRPDLHPTTERDLRDGSGALRLRRPEPGEVIVLSYDGLPAPLEGTTKICSDPLGSTWLVLDECHRVKGESARRTQRTRMLASQCAVVHGLSATPMPGEPTDLWGLLVTMGLGERLFKSRERFVELCGGRKRMVRDKRRDKLVQRGWVWGSVSPEVREIVSSVVLRRTRNEVGIELPRVQRITKHIEAPDDLRPYLNEVTEKWDELIARGELGPDDLPPFELLSTARAALARSRTQAAVEWAEDAIASGIQSIVFCDHVDPLLAVAELAGAEAYIGSVSQAERERIVERFRNGETRLLAMSIESGGVGLNLQQASAELFIDQGWTPADYDQAEARAVRPGGHECVLVTTMSSDHPLDLRLHEILAEKRRLNREVFG